MCMYFAFYAPSLEIDSALGVIYRFYYKLNAIVNYFQFYFGSMHRINYIQIGASKMLLDKFLSLPCYFQLAQWSGNWDWYRLVTKLLKMLPLYPLVANSVLQSHR